MLCGQGHLEQPFASSTVNSSMPNPRHRWSPAIGSVFIFWFQSEKLRALELVVHRSWLFLGKTVSAGVRPSWNVFCKTCKTKTNVSCENEVLMIFLTLQKPLPNLTIAHFKSPRSLYFRASPQPSRSAVFFPNSARGGLELREPYPRRFCIQ